METVEEEAAQNFEEVVVAEAVELWVRAEKEGTVVEEVVIGTLLDMVEMVVEVLVGKSIVHPSSHAPPPMSRRSPPSRACFHHQRRLDRQLGVVSAERQLSYQHVVVQLTSHVVAVLVLCRMFR